MAKTKVPGGYIDDGSITSSHLHSSHGITTNDIGEHTNNKYYTDARVDARLAASKSANLFTTGNIEIGSDTGKLRLGTGADLRLYHNGTNSFIDNFTGDLVIQQGVDDADIILKTDDGSGGTTAYLTLDGSAGHTYVHKALVLGNDTTFKIGNSSALQFSHNGSNTFIGNNVGILYLTQNVDDGVIHLRNDDGSGGVTNYITLHGGTGEVRLSHYGNIKLKTQSDGIDVTGHIDATTLTTTGNVAVGGNLTVTGTTTTVNTVTMNAQNAVVFEGATADAHETTLTIIDPTADRTINLPNQSGTIPVLAAASNTAITATPAELNYVDGVTSNIQTQLNAKQATISSSTDLTLSSIVATSSNESRFQALNIGADSDVYLYESATNAFTIRTGASGAYKYFTFAADGKLNLANDGLQIGGTEVISGGRNISNVGTVTASGVITASSTSGHRLGRLTLRDDSIEEQQTNTDTATVAISYNGYSGGTTKFRDFAIFDGKQTAVARFTGSDKTLNVVGGYKLNGTTIVDSSRNLTNIGTIGSGAITSTGTIKSQATTGNNRGVSLSINGEIAQTSSISDWLHLQRYHDGRVAIGNNSSSFLYVKNYIDVVSNYRLNNTVIVDSSRNLTNIGTISSGAITTSGNIILSSGNKVIFGGDDTYNAHLQYTDNGSGDHFLSIKTEHNDTITERIKVHAQTGVITFNGAYTFPTSDGSANQVLQTDGSGALSFATVSSGGSGFSTITEPSAGQIKIGAQSGANEGGEILLENAAANGGGSYTTDIHLDNYQNKFRIHSGGSVDLTVDTSGNVTVPGTLEGSGNILAQGYYRIHGSGVLLRLEEDSWTNATTHDILYNGWKSSLGDYIYLQAAGNGTPVGRILVTDTGGFYFGTSSSTTGVVADSATAPLTNTRFRVDNSGNVYPHGNISIGGTATDGNYGVYLQDNHWYATQYSSSHDVVRMNANTAGGLDIYNQTDSAFAVIRTGGVNIGSTQVIDGSRNLTNIGTISSGAITSSGAISTSSGGTALTTSANAAVFAHGFTAGSRGFNFESGDESVGTIRFDANTMRIWSGGAGGGNERIRINDGSTGGGDIFFYGSIDIKSGGLEIGDTSVINSSRVLQNVTANASIITAGTFGAARIPNLDAGKITSGTINSARLATGASGNWWAGNVVKVATDGVMEIGKYIDFHNTDTTTADYDVRLQVHSTNNLSIQGSGRILTTGDEGSGNGLDADTVDGVEASSFLRSDTADTATGNITLGASTKLIFGNNTAYGIGAGGHNYRSGYFDTLESGGASDPLELVYYQGNKVNIGGSGGNKPLSAGSFEITGTSVINSSRGLTNITSANVAGNVTIDYTGNATNDAGLYVANDNSDWGIYVNKDGTATYGIKIAADGAYPFQITNSSGTEKFRVDSDGDVILAGTVDGRDVAADGTKLDGIAANANNYSFPYTVSSSAGNSSVVQRTSNGYIFANYFNTTANDVSSGLTKIACEVNNDSYIRWSDAAGVRSFINVGDLGGLSVHSGRNNEANKIVRTDANGYIQAGWINTTSGSTTSVIDRIYASYDGYIRYYTPANYFNAGGMGEKQFNNQGRNHSTYTNFNTDMPAGVHYLQQGNNGPTGTASHQFYGMKFGLGNEYGTTGSGGSDYSAQMYFPRAAQGGGNGLYFRDKEGGSFGSWRQVDAGTVTGFAPSAGSSAIGASQLLRSHTNNYIYTNWINVGVYGIYSGTNGAHFYPNTLGSYGTWRINGTRGGYSGIMMDGGGDVVTGMFDGSGNGGDWNNSSGWHYYYHRSNDCLGVSASTTSSSYGLYVTGAIYATADIVGSSDERLKTEIKTIPNALDKVLKLRGVTYKWRDPEEGGTCVNNITETRMGVIAQEVVDVVPEVVTHDKENDRYGVSYGHLTGVLIEAVKELKQEVNELKKELEEVKNG